MTLSAKPKNLTTSAFQESVSRTKRCNAWQATCRRGLVDALSRIQHGSLLLRDGEVSEMIGSRGQNSEIDAEISVRDPAFYANLATGGTLAAAESFLAGEWTTPDLVRVIRLLARNRDVLEDVESRTGWMKQLAARFLSVWNRNSRLGSQKNISAHYDLGNEFFELFLDPTMTYSSGIFEHEKTSLEGASLAKYDRVCRQLDLKATDHVLEIGSGWGGFALFAAKNFGCRVTTTTISTEQFDFAQRKIAMSDVEDRIELRQQDYRDLSGQFDKLVSIEMIEAVGHDYLPTYFQKCSQLLRPHGRMLLQAITIPDQRYEAYRKSVDFIQKYIFPGGCLPSVARILNVISSHTDMEIESHFEFGLDYARTLRHWHNALNASREKVRQMGKDEVFLRAWQYYFAYCEAAFRERQIGVCHLLFNKPDYRATAV